MPCVFFNEGSYVLQPCCAVLPSAVLLLGIARSACLLLVLALPSRALAPVTTFKLGSPIVINFILWLIIGGVLGWLASLVMKTDAQQGVFLNIVVGILGAFLGGLLLSRLFGTGTINQVNFSLSSLLVSFLGALVLLAIVNFFRRRGVR